MDYGAFKTLAEDYKKGMIQITPRCMYRCKFCYNKFLPPCLNDKYVDNNQHVDLLSFTKLIRMVSTSSIILGESANFSEGDIMAHPQWRKLVETTNYYHKYKNIFFSTAKVLTADEIKFLAGRVDELAHTFTSFEKTVHQELTGGGETREQIENMFNSIQKHGLKTRIKIIPVKDFYGWPRIESDLEKLTSIDEVYSIDILYPGYTRYTPDELKNKLDFKKQSFIKKINSFRDEYGSVVMAGNLSVPNNYRQKKENLMEKIKIHTFQDSKILLLVSERMRPVAKKAVFELTEKYSGQVEYLVIKNNFFGGNIEVGGLLVVEDYLQKKAEINEINADIILTTSAPFRHQDNRDLQKVHRSKLEEEFNSPIIFI